jgi:hypothetical protein
MKDAKGHGSDKRGEAANGDPRREAIQSRFIPGHGVAPRSQVVARHNNMPSVGTNIGQTPVQAENAPFISRLPGPHFLDPNDPRGARAAKRRSK